MGKHIQRHSHPQSTEVASRNLEEETRLQEEVDANLERVARVWTAAETIVLRIGQDLLETDEVNSGPQ